jgi:hypothetical protein
MISMAPSGTKPHERGAAPTATRQRKRGHRGGRRRGKIATLEGRLWRAVEVLREEEKIDRGGDEAARLRQQIFGGDAASPDGLWAEVRAARHHREDECRRTLARRLGISQDGLASLEQRYSRTVPPAPDPTTKRGGVLR